MLIRNHLNYRISASLRAESFRRLQAFSLNEVQNNHKYQFHEDSKSALVLQYDLWNEWLSFVEKTLINMEPQGAMSHKMAMLICMEAKKTHGTYLKLISEELDMFSEKFSHLHTKTNSIMRDRFLHKIEKCEGKTQINSIVYLSKSLERFLHSSLYELQEVDYLVFNYEEKDKFSDPFLSIDQQDLNDDNNKKDPTSIDRLLVYLKNYNLKDLTVKSYIDAPCNLNLLLHKVEMLGVHITKVVY